MNKKYLPLILIAILLFIPNLFALQVSGLEGSWTARIKGEKIRMTLNLFFEDPEFRDGWNTTSYFNKDEFKNIVLDKEQEYKISREAGSIILFGKFKENRGYGDFTFSPDEPFRAFLAEKGY